MIIRDCFTDLRQAARSREKLEALSEKVETILAHILLLVWIFAIGATGIGANVYMLLGRRHEAMILFATCAAQLALSLITIHLSLITFSNGCTRFVLLTDNYAIKLPQFKYGWKNFLAGLLANMQERTFATTKWPELCPVTFSVPGGWLVVMQRASNLKDEEWEVFKHGIEDWCNRENYYIPVEPKRDSFGVITIRKEFTPTNFRTFHPIVAIDYGGYMSPLSPSDFRLQTKRHAALPS
jgi:hypothetical protein